MTEVKQDEVTLLALWWTLVAQKKVIAVVWAVCSILGVGYSFLATPTYKAEAFMLPANEKSIQPLNIQVFEGASGASGASGVRTKYEPGKVYMFFLQALRSRANRRAFFERHGVAAALNFRTKGDLEKVFEEKFNGLLQVNQNVRKKEMDGFSSLTFEGESPALVAQWTNTFIEETERLVSQGLVDDVMSKVDSLKRNIEELIQSKKLLAVARREDRIVALEEALQIALSMRNGTPSAQAKVQRGDVAVNTDELPLYMLSSGALVAEISVLKNRKDDAPFIEGLRDLEEELARLKQIYIQVKDVHVMRLDQQASTPVEPEKPKKGLIVTLAMLLGLVLGVVVGLVRNGVLILKGKGLQI